MTVPSPNPAGHCPICGESLFEGAAPEGPEGVFKNVCLNGHQSFHRAGIQYETLEEIPA